MASDINSVTNTGAGALNSALGARKSNEDVNKMEFLQLLVTQLKSQDPLDPMKNDQFAVNLAQFSQLEQLVAINEKVGKQGAGGDLSSLAGYLGHEVTLNTTKLTVANGESDNLKIDLPTDATRVDVKIFDKDGQLVDTIDMGAMTKGPHTLDIDAGANVNGEFSFEVVATGTGGSYKTNASVVGTVTGFIPGADPKLIVGNREISPADVRQVNMVK